MFTASQTRVPASAPYERDPRVMPISRIGYGQLYMRESSTNYATENAAFWTNFANVGSYQTSDPTSATRTVLNVTGRGRLTGVVGPNATAASSTTFTITVDGLAYTITIPANGSFAGRIVLGDCFRYGTEATTASDVNGYAQSDSRTGATMVSKGYYVGPLIMRSPVHFTRFLKFDTSLKVEVACGTLGANGNDAYAGALWNLDG